MDERVDVGFGEEALGALGVEVGERGLVEGADLHHALAGEVVHDLADEVGLSAGEGAAAVAEEGREGVADGGAVEADEAADEGGEAAELAVEGGELVLALADVGGEEEALELVEVGRGQGLIGA